MISKGLLQNPKKSVCCSTEYGPVRPPEKQGHAGVTRIDGSHRRGERRPGGGGSLGGHGDSGAMPRRWAIACAWYLLVVPIDSRIDYKVLY
jgi:hypothetical protein